MRHFLRKAALFGSIQLVILALALLYYRVDRNAYAAAYIDKHRRLAEVASPRVLLVGGSNVAFATDSALLEERLGWPIVNLGLQHAMGLRFMLNEARRASHRGDVVVLSMEYDQYLGRAEQAISVFGVLEQAPRQAAADFDVDWPLFKLLLDGTHSWLRGVLRSDLARARGGGSAAQAPYSRSSFNAYGDVVAHWSMRAPGFVSSAQQEQPEGDAAIAELNAFAEDAARRGVRVYAFHPTTSAKKYTAMRLDRLQERLTRELRFKQLNRIDEMRYPDELFFDGTYHLTFPGVQRRTRLLAERLGPELGSRAAAL